MAEAPPLMLDVANRIERNIGESGLKRTAPPNEPFPEQHAVFGAAIAYKAKGGRPRNKVFCFGQEDVGRLGDILAFYTADRLEPHFYLAPMGFTKKVAEALSRAGFAQVAFEQALLYGVPMETPASLPPGMTIEEVTNDNLEEFVQTTADGFEWPKAWREAAMEGVRTGAATDSYRFLARYEGEPAGVGVLRVDKDGIGHVVGGAVAPKFRRRGCHRALVQHRLHAAHGLGVQFIMGAANFTSASFRNQQRAGLRLAYVESEWARLRNGN